MELTFLGTGAGMPSTRRNVSSVVLDLMAENGSCWMFDCGEGTQHQLLRSHVKPGRIDRIFITHLHGDHLFGLPGFLTSRSHQGGDSPVTVFGPVGTESFVRTALAVSESRLDYELLFVELDKEGLVYEDAAMTVEMDRLAHRIESFGYRIVERDLPGALDMERLAPYGLKSGPILGRLKRGETVRLEDGSELDGRRFVGPAKPGRIVAIMGDTARCDSAVRLARGADALVHEATFAAAQQDKARRYGHATAEDAARTAAEAGAAMLLMTHVSSRYQEEEEQALLAEARAIFANAHIAHDWATWTIARRDNAASKESSL